MINGIPRGKVPPTNETFRTVLKVMEIVFTALLEVALTLIQILISVPIMWIGEVSLFLVSLGHHKPKWDVYIHRGDGVFVFLSTISFWIGTFVLCTVGILCKLYFSK